MRKQRLKLRGHHIATFAIDYWGYKEYEKGKSPLDLLGLIYGQRMKELFDNVCSLLKSRPDTQVEIVDGLDSLCKSYCPELTPECSQIELNSEDAFTLQKYGLEVGGIYTAREIVQRVRDFTMRTGMKSPRNIKRSGQDSDLLM